MRAAVLVAVDGSAGGWEALAWAAAEAAANGLSLCVVHVVRWPRLDDTLSVPPVDRAAAVRAAGERVLADAERRAREIAPDLGVVTRLEADTRPGSGILRASEDASLIVLGRRRRAGRRFNRSVGSYVARRSRRPVAVVGLSDAAPGPSTGRVAVLLDDRNEPAAALAVAHRAAARRGIEVTVLHSGSSRNPDALGAASAGAALLVVGTTRPRHRHRAFLAPAARALVDAARTPVLIVDAAGTA